MISFESNRALKEATETVCDMNHSCPHAGRETRSLLRFLKSECISKRLAWQVYVQTKKLAQRRGLVLS